LLAKTRNSLIAAHVRRGRGITESAADYDFEIRPGPKSVSAETGASVL